MLKSKLHGAILGATSKSVSTIPTVMIGDGNKFPKGTLADLNAIVETIEKESSDLDVSKFATNLDAAEASGKITIDLKNNENAVLDSFAIYAVTDGANTAGLMSPNHHTKISNSFSGATVEDNNGDIVLKFTTNNNETHSVTIPKSMFAIYGNIPTEAGMVPVSDGNGGVTWQKLS